MEQIKDEIKLKIEKIGFVKKGTRSEKNIDKHEKISNISVNRIRTNNFKGMSSPTSYAFYSILAKINNI